MKRFMQKKYLLIALLVVSLLTVAFFWGGNTNKSNINNENSTQTQLVNDNSVSSNSTTDQKRVDSNSQSIKQNSNDATLNSESQNTAKEVLSKSEGKDNLTTSESTEKSSLKPTQKNKNDSISKSTENTKTASNSASKKDKYLTDPVPAGKPKPVEWQSTTINKEKKLTCTLSVTCKSILNNMDKFNKDKLEVLPKDGIILKKSKVTFNEGESVFDVLLREMKKNKIHMEFEMTPIYNSNYIEGIHNLYEFDCGELSGWMYKINGWFPNYGCSRYMLKNGDNVEWIYTCDLGRDIGGGTAVRDQQG